MLILSWVLDMHIIQILDTQQRQCSHWKPNKKTTKTVGIECWQTQIQMIEIEYNTVNIILLCEACHSWMIPRHLVTPLKERLLTCASCLFRHKCLYNFFFFLCCFRTVPLFGIVWYCLVLSLPIACLFPLAATACKGCCCFATFS